MLRIPVQAPEVYSRGQFIYKAGNLYSLIKRQVTKRKESEDFMVEEIIILNAREWMDFVNDFYQGYDFLNGKGGHESTTATQAHEKDWILWTKEEHEQYEKGLYRSCVAVFHGEVKDGEIQKVDFHQFVIVDPQGYSNARYAMWGEYYQQQEEYHDALSENIRREIANYN